MGTFIRYHPPRLFAHRSSFRQRRKLASGSLQRRRAARSALRPPRDSRDGVRCGDPRARTPGARVQSARTLAPGVRTTAQGRRGGTQKNQLPACIAMHYITNIHYMLLHHDVIFELVYVVIKSHVSKRVHH